MGRSSLEASSPGLRIGNYMASLQHRLIAAAPAALVSFCPVHAETTFVFMRLPIIDDFDYRYSLLAIPLFARS
jgi:hypothetical protein